MSAYLIGISGPPRSGKDTLGAVLAAAIEDRFEVQPQVMQQSLPMRHMIYALMGMEYSLLHYEQNKDVPQVSLDGTTIRQAMIAISEEHVKPRYGKGQWARAAINRRWISNPKVMIVTDMGFEEEVDVFEKHFGRASCMWPQLKRPGHSFDNDSRSYVGTPSRAFMLDNPGIGPRGGMDFFAAASRTICDAIDDWGWDLS